MPSFDVKKKHPKFDTHDDPRISRRWGRTSVSGLLGLTFVQDAWWWKSIQRCAGNAETPPRPPATMQWRPVGGWSAVEGGEPMSQVKSTADWCIRRRLVSSAVAVIEPLCQRLASILQQLSTIDLHRQPWKSWWPNDNKCISQSLVFSAKIFPTFLDLYESIR